MKNSDRLEELERRLDGIEQCLRAFVPKLADKYLGAENKPKTIPPVKPGPTVRVSEPTAQTTEREMAALEAVASGKARALPVKPLF